MSERLARWMAAIGLLFLAFAVSCRKLGDFDLPWHLATGKLIWATDGIPRVDDLAYTHGIVKYTEVISDILFYAAVRAGGPLGLQILGGLLAALVGALILRRAQRSRQPAYLATALVLCAIQSWFVVRSTTLALGLFSLGLLFLHIHRTQPSTRTGRTALWSLIVVQFLWANIHGSAVLGIILLAWYFCSRCLATVFRARDLRCLPACDRGHVRETGMVVAVSILATMLNTAGPKLLLGPFRGSERLQIFSEWARPSWSFLMQNEPVVLACFGLALIALVVGRSQDTQSRLPSVLDVGHVVLAILFAITAIRLLPLAAILLTAWIGGRLAHWAVRIPAAACAAFLFVPPILAYANPSIPRGIGWDTTHFPEGAVQYVEKHELRGAMWNSIPYGGYLAWRLHPKYRVFMDGRNTLARDAALVDLALASEQNPKAFDYAAQQFDMQWAIVPAFEGSGFGTAMAGSKAWAMVYLDDSSAVYVRRNGPNGELARQGYEWLRHRTSPQDALLAALAPNGPGSHLAHDGQLASEQAPSSPRAAFLQGCGAVALRRQDDFDHALTSIQRLAPAHPTIGVLRWAWGKKEGSSRPDSRSPGGLEPGIEE